MRRKETKKRRSHVKMNVLSSNLTKSALFPGVNQRFSGYGLNPDSNTLTITSTVMSIVSN